MDAGSVFFENQFQQSVKFKTAVKDMVTQTTSVIYITAQLRTTEGSCRNISLKTLVLPDDM